MSEIDATLVKDGQKVVATVSQSGTIISDPSAVDATALVQTDDGPQLCVKTFEMGEGGGGGGGSVTVDSALSTTSENPVQNKVITNALENVYTQDNLVAGTNISITPVSQPVFDANTLGVWHLDDATGANAITEGAYAQTKLFTTAHVYTTSFHKFGAGACLINTVSSSSADSLLLNITSTIASNNFTLDMWVRTPTGSNQNSRASIVFGMSTSLYVYLANNRIQIGSNQTSTTAGTWHHVAMERYNNTLNGYVDGTLIYTDSTSQTASFDIKVTNGNQTDVPGACFDEVRLSNVARYQGQNFTPFEVAYSTTFPPKYQINSTQPAPDLSRYLQNTATGNNSLTILGSPITAGHSVNIGEGSSSTGNYTVGLGYNAKTSAIGAIAIGNCQAQKQYAISIGRNAYTSGDYAICIATSSNISNASGNNSIQLGEGTNGNANTFQVFSFQLLDGTTGLIPASRIGTGYDASKTQVLKNVNGTLTWVDE